MNETERPVFLPGADGRQWNGRNREQMRALILASAETFAVLGVEGAPWHAVKEVPSWRHTRGWATAA